MTDSPSRGAGSVAAIASTLGTGAGALVFWAVTAVTGALDDTRKDVAAVRTMLEHQQKVLVDHGSWIDSVGRDCIKGRANGPE